MNSEGYELIAALKRRYPLPLDEDAGELPCKRDPDSWYPVAQSRAGGQVAKCAECPLRLQCLIAGCTESYGVWGGIGERERAKLVRSGQIFPILRDMIADLR